MAVLDTILPEISRSASLSIEIYHFAASCKGEAVQESVSVARSINTFSALLKQVGTLFKEDDHLPSHAVSWPCFVLLSPFCHIHVYARMLQHSPTPRCQKPSIKTACGSISNEKAKHTFSRNRFLHNLSNHYAVGYRDPGGCHRAISLHADAHQTRLTH